MSPDDYFVFAARGDVPFCCAVYCDVFYCVLFRAYPAVSSDIRASGGGDCVDQWPLPSPWDAFARPDVAETIRQETQVLIKSVHTHCSISGMSCILLSNLFQFGKLLCPSHGTVIRKVK